MEGGLGSCAIPPLLMIYFREKTARLRSESGHRSIFVNWRANKSSIDSASVLGSVLSFDGSPASVPPLILGSRGFGLPPHNPKPKWNP